MKNKAIVLVMFAMVLAMLASGTAWAADSVLAKISNVSPAYEDLTVNGNSLALDTYAGGSIQLTFYYTGTSFTSGSFGASIWVWR